MVLEGKKGRGRVVIDCGWTKLMQLYFAGNYRYVRNCAVWLLWLENLASKNKLK